MTVAASRRHWRGLADEGEILMRALGVSSCGHAERAAYVRALGLQAPPLLLPALVRRYPRWLSLYEPLQRPNLLSERMRIAMLIIDISPAATRIAYRYTTVAPHTVLAELSLIALRTAATLPFRAWLGGRFR